MRNTAAVAKVKALDRQLQALEMRKEGASYRAIARSLGFKGPSGAHAAVAQALTDTLTEATDALRTLEAERLDALMMAHWKLAIQGNGAATDRVLDILAQRAKLLGLNAPVKSEVTGKGGGPVQLDVRTLSDDELRTIVGSSGQG